MILSEYDRRWAEVRFYQFCIETYTVRHKTIDIINYAETICNLGDANWQTIRNTIQVMMNDTYYQASKRELILLADVKGLSTVQIGKYLNMTRQGVSKYINTHKELFTPLPRCGIDEDCELIKFLNTLDKFNPVGSYGNGTTNESTI